ncbi:MAG TPA: response regulator [Terriglobia bacterium]|nr:response regulator [Terriglobia bacterium]
MPIDLKILAVDDEMAALELFKSIVGPLGYNVVGLTDSREAAQRVMQEKFDLVALDVHMPNLNGFELTKRIRQSSANPRVPILMFTSCDDIATMREGFASGVTFYIAKPFSVVKLRGLFSAARGIMIQERRRYIRLPLGVDVKCTLGGRRFKARSLDLAQGGILLEGSGGIADGEIVEIEFSVPGETQPLKIMAKVAGKSGSQGTALEFIEPEASDRAALERFVIAQTEDKKAA